MRKRLQVRKGRAQALTLQLVEHCVRTCGEPFHRELASSELFPELVRMTDQSAWCPPEVQQQVLALLQEWAYTLRPSAFVNTYNKLRARGMAFPSRTGEGATYTAPAGSPAASFQPYPGLSPPPPPSQPGSGAGINPAADLFGAGDAYPGSPNAVSTPARGSALLSPGQPPAKLKADLEVARNTVALLQEVLGGVPENDPAGVKEDYVTDMAEQARAMRTRLTGLIERLDDEALLGAALEINDEAQRALDKYSTLVDVAEGRRAPPPRLGAQQQPQAPPLPSTAPYPRVSQPAPPPQPAQPAPPLIVTDLLSLDDWTPDVPAPGPGPTVWATAAPTAANGGTGVPPLPVQRSNNPFAEENVTQTTTDGLAAPGESGGIAPPSPFPAPVAPSPRPLPSSLSPSVAVPETTAVSSNPFFSDLAWSPSGGVEPTTTTQASRPPPLTQLPSPGPASSFATSSPSPDGGLTSAGSAPPTTTGSNPFASAPLPVGSANPFGTPNLDVPMLELSPRPGTSSVPSPAISYPPLYSEPLTSARSTATAGSVAPLADAFEGLVTLQKKTDEAPPPPKYVGCCEIG